MSEPTRRLTLRDLPFVARLVLAVFLISVGLGYLAALAQLSIQQASPGQPLPGKKEVIDAYHGEPGVGTLERLIVANENLPFTASGSMRSAFTTRSTDWLDSTFEDQAISDFVGNLDGLSDEEKEEKQKKKMEEWEKLPTAEREKKIEEGKQQVRKQREGEAAVLVDWIHHGPDEKFYGKDKWYPLPDSLQDVTITPNPKWVKKDKDGKKSVQIHALFRARCVRCHQEGRDADFAPMVTFKQIAAYAKNDVGQGGMPLRKLAQSTHVHLLGFSMLYMLTGLIFALSSWPAIIRFLIAPLALVAQVVDISFWWLARLPDPYGTQFAEAIMYSGGVVGVALALQIILGLFSLFGWFGRFVILLLLLLGGAGAYYVGITVIVPYLSSQAKITMPVP